MREDRERRRERGREERERRREGVERRNGGQGKLGVKRELLEQAFSDNNTHTYILCTHIHTPLANKADIIKENDCLGVALKPTDT